MLNHENERKYYSGIAERHARIAKAFDREDVQRVLKQHPDADSCWCFLIDYDGHWQTCINLTVNLPSDPVIENYANAVNGTDYVLEEKHIALDTQWTKVTVTVRTKCPIPPVDMQLLRDLGKIMTDTTEAIFCESPI